MSIHRYRSRCVDSALFPQFVPVAASISAVGTRAVLDIDLSNDAFKDDLDAFLFGWGLEFVETSPTTPVPNCLQTFSFSGTSLTLGVGTDNFFAFNRPSITGSIDVSGTVGIGRFLLSPRSGNFTRLIIRSDVGMTIDGFVFVNGTRTVVADDIVLVGGTASVLDLTPIISFTAGQELQAGIVRTVGAGSATIEATLEINFAP